MKQNRKNYFKQQIDKRWNVIYIYNHKEILGKIQGKIPGSIPDESKRKREIENLAVEQDL